MQEIELQYCATRAQVRAALEELRAMSLRYMEVTRQTMLAYLAIHYPDLTVEIIASLRDITHPNSFDYTLHFDFKYPGITPEQSRPITREVWDYIHTLDIPLIGVTHNTALDTI